MTITGSIVTPKAKIDWTKPVLWLFAACLIALIVLPMSWLAIYSVTDKANHLTLQNFVTLFTDPDFLDPLLTTAIIATTSAIICCTVAAPMGWLVSRTDMPGRQFIRALVTASFVTPPFLGAVAWELLAAPNSGLLNQLYRVVTGAEADDHLFNIYSLAGVIFVISCYTFPFVFVLVANALDNMPGELEDASAILGGRAWTTARRVTIPLALPALVAGALIAFLQAMTLFGSPAILALPAGFHTMTTKIWSLFQYPPKLELAAAAAVPLLILTILLLQGQKFLLGRRGYSVLGGKYGAPRRVEMKKWRWAALAFCLLMLLNPVFLPYFALFNAAFSPNATTLVTPSTFTLHNIVFVFTELSSTQLALKNTVILGAATATIGTLLALVIAYVTARRVIAGHRVLGFLATAPVAVPGIVLGVGLFLSYTRPPFVLYGTLWILLIAFLTINLPSAYQQLQAAFTTIHPELEDASRILGATRLQSLRQITAPLLRTGVIATWCFIFIGVMRELSAAIVLFTSQTKVISVLIYDLNESGDLAAISVLGIAMLVITFAVVLAINRIPMFGGNAGTRLRNA
ncbi:MAG: ABC transporter permease [Bradyrhizobium sp.]